MRDFGAALGLGAALLGAAIVWAARTLL